jgi:hypothetical protein
VRRATVTLTGGPPVVNGRGGGRISATDDMGRFLFGGLPPGRYSVSASKPGWVATQYGSKRPGHPSGVAIVLDQGQQLPSITMRMTHGVVITGTISAEGRALPQNLQVRVLQFQTVRGQRQLVSAPGSTTIDERGVYRVYGLVPGEFLIAAQAFGFDSVEVHEPTTDQLQWAQQLLQKPANASSPTPGASPAVAPDLPTPPPSPHPVGFSLVYYPGTVTPRDATPITLRAGEERVGADFSLHLVPTATVSGTVTDPEGRQLQNVQLTLSMQVTAGVGLSDTRNAPVAAGDGRFAFKGVPPGNYTLTARAIARPTIAGPERAVDATPGAPPAPPAPAAAGRAGGGGGPAGQAPAPQVTLWAVTDVFVDGIDVPDLDLRLQSGMTVSGRIAFDPTATPPDLSRGRVSLTWMGAGNGPLSGTPSAAIAADGTFALTGVMPGQYQISAAAGAFSMKSVLINNLDVTDASFEVRPNQGPGNVVVTLTDKRTELGGTLLDGSGKPTPDYFVVMFPADKSLWRWEALLRRVRSARPDTAGRYLIIGPPSGEYFLSALTDFDSADLFDPAFLAQLAASAIKLTLGEGEKKTQDMKIGGGGVQ